MESKVEGFYIMVMLSTKDYILFRGLCLHRTKLCPVRTQAMESIFLITWCPNNPAGTDLQSVSNELWILNPSL